MDATKRFDGRVAVVTGGASGIGLAIAKRFAAEAARVVIVDYNQAGLDAVMPLVRDAGATETLALLCDVSDEQQVRATVEAVMARLGRFDVLVNNTGLMQFKPLEQYTGADWLKVLSVDLLGAFFFTKQAFLHMGDGGAIVNVASIHAVETTPQVASYAAATAALLSLSRSTAIEGKPRGIRANAILPGAVDTPMLRENPNVRSGVEKLDERYIGRPEDIAALVAYLASDDARFVQGAEIRADGGRLDRL
jgi:NAD(P)-dependent dehydrogenase (short-subunit alcohol dehydrogenase family)